MKITILGTGDTVGTPALNCYCETCKHARAHPEHARTRFSILIESDEGKNILIDASPDLRFQLIRAGVERIHAIFLTHEHYDHAGGLFNFYRYRTKATEKILLFAGQDVLDYLIIRPKLQNVLPFKRRAIDLHEEVEYAGISFQSFQVYHKSRNENIQARGYLLKFRNKKILISGDLSPKTPEATLDMISCEPDLAFVDVFTDREVDFLRDKHFVLSEAIDFCERVKARKVVFVHMSHYVPPHPQFEEKIKQYGNNYVVGLDGMSFEF
ncbi:MAG: MBL fold metallo-hydrolase [Candidatus Helarchaeales archaeon]